jgi:hypothetical protein
MRAEVRAFTADGPLPGSDASVEEIERREKQLTAILMPVTAREARALVACFGPDDCFGMAWSLLHLIETCPNPVLRVEPAPEANWWERRLWQRIVAGGLAPVAAP